MCGTKKCVRYTIKKYEIESMQNPNKNTCKKIAKLTFDLCERYQRHIVNNKQTINR
jgi:hypothetical protein